MVTTDGRMGYCRLTQRRTIPKVRQAEAEQSFQILGLPAGAAPLPPLPGLQPEPLPRPALRHDRRSDRGRKGPAACKTPTRYILRQIRPTRVFLPTITDLHPDHRIVNEEMLISLFHAQGHLAGAGAADRDRAGGLRVCHLLRFPRGRRSSASPAPQAMLERKLEAIRAYASQEQIERPHRRAAASRAGRVYPRGAVQLLRAEAIRPVVPKHEI